MGGKNIQKIMKKFGVYVKFSNMQEFQGIGGYYENQDNVICRTPWKNKDNLKDLKSSIVETVNQLDLVDVYDTFEVSRLAMPWVVEGDHLKECWNLFRCRVEVPDGESGSGVLTLHGPESNMEKVKEKLKVLYKIEGRRGRLLSRVFKFLRVLESTGWLNPKSLNKSGKFWQRNLKLLVALYRLLMERERKGREKRMLETIPFF